MWDPSLRVLPPSLINLIEHYWNKEIQQTTKSNYLVNGELCRLNSWEIVQNKLILSLGRTSYKELLYSNNFVQLVKSKRNGEEILNLSFHNNSSELSKVFIIPNNSESLISFLINNEEQISPSAFGALWLYVQEI